jgi:hypothetical protein
VYGFERIQAVFIDYRVLEEASCVACDLRIRKFCLSDFYNCIVYVSYGVLFRIFCR